MAHGVVLEPAPAASRRDRHQLGPRHPPVSPKEPPDMRVPTRRRSAPKTAAHRLPDPRPHRQVFLIPLHLWQGPIFPRSRSSAASLCPDWIEKAKKLTAASTHKFTGHRRLARLHGRIGFAWAPCACSLSCRSSPAGSDRGRNTRLMRPRRSKIRIRREPNPAGGCTEHAGRIVARHEHCSRSS